MTLANMDSPLILHEIKSCFVVIDIFCCWVCWDDFIWSRKSPVWPPISTFLLFVTLCTRQSDVIQYGRWNPEIDIVRGYTSFNEAPVQFSLYLRPMDSDIVWDHRLLNSLFKKKLSGWHQIKHLCSALMALCEGNPPVTGGFPDKEPVIRKVTMYVVIACLRVHIIGFRIRKVGITERFSCPTCHSSKKSMSTCLTVNNNAKWRYLATLFEHLNTS